jgi:hypothetical protein
VAAHASVHLDVPSTGRPTVLNVLVCLCKGADGKGVRVFSFGLDDLSSSAFSRDNQHLPGRPDILTNAHAELDTVEDGITGPGHGKTLMS